MSRLLPFVGVVGDDGKVSLIGIHYDANRQQGVLGRFIAGRALRSCGGLPTVKAAAQQGGRWWLPNAALLTVLRDLIYDKTPGTAAQVMDGDGYIHSKAGLVKTPPQAGQVNGLKAVRQYFKFMGSDGHERHGFHYVVMDGSKRSLIVVVDEEPHSKTSLPLAEASVLTLRK